jgi:hypothetical protein
MSRFVLHYLGPADPSQEEEGQLLSSLKHATVIDRMPGTLLVDGAASDLAAITRKFTKWRCSPEVSVAVNPPRKRILHTL